MIVLVLQNYLISDKKTYICKIIGLKNENLYFNTK